MVGKFDFVTGNSSTAFVATSLWLVMPFTQIVPCLIRHALYRCLIFSDGSCFNIHNMFDCPIPLFIENAWLSQKQMVLCLVILLRC